MFKTTHSLPNCLILSLAAIPKLAASPELAASPALDAALRLVTTPALVANPKLAASSSLTASPARLAGPVLCGERRALCQLGPASSAPPHSLNNTGDILNDVSIPSPPRKLALVSPQTM